MCLTNMREAAFKMMKFAKQKGCTVIVSSSILLIILNNTWRKEPILFYWEKQNKHLLN